MPPPALVVRRNTGDIELGALETRIRHNGMGNASVVREEVVFRKPESFHQSDQLCDHGPLQDVRSRRHLGRPMGRVGMVSENTALTLDSSVYRIRLDERRTAEIGEFRIPRNPSVKK